MPPHLSSTPPPSNNSPILSLPPEILTQISLASIPLSGPPTPARALGLTCRAFHASLGYRTNAPLYAAIFPLQFDSLAPKRRGADFHPESVGHELRNRWSVLASIRRAVRSHTLQESPERELWVALTLLMEDDGLNACQLAWAGLDEYIQLFWQERILRPSMDMSLPEETEERALGFWVLWLTCEEGILEREAALTQQAALYALRPYAFAAHKYDIFSAPWYEPVMPLLPSPSSSPSASSPSASTSNEPAPAGSEPRTKIPYFGHLLPVSPPPAGLAAIMLFSLRTSLSPPDAAPMPLAMPLAPVAQPMHHTATPTAANTAHGAGQLEVVRPPYARELSEDRGSHVWDSDWGRITGCWDLLAGLGLGRETHVDGVWEGKFTFFDFDSYRDMLTGSTRSVYEGAFASQPQVWRLLTRLSPIPESRRRQVLAERRERGAGDGEMTGMDSVLDGEWRWEEEERVLEGEGHSAWGEFRLVGSVRGWDGLVSLRKEYTPVARGTWLYRGYLIGERYLVGRWRDTFTEKTQDGYEGIFALARRE
ncbi:hypothetical protein DACRYDRAFT_18934 [Dacryopinax primogenitus]|uniref:F-box domain-containing protein n=1 Tax=Dacryopinax primogenitus (strain DJM 731) TaxID=1858805 RepID=M5FV97_DACPD|nr:uncharacterized protein DACRYDRAFT_18934 [Dacryopinax primogenitus]EJT97236.1 hypothetical protein DACRYDRAFT_18934 [Dacryopinax primogenitus]